MAKKPTNKKAAGKPSKTTSEESTDKPSANQYVTKYLTFLIFAMALIQGYIAWNDNQVDATSMVMLAGVALVYFYFAYFKAFMPGPIGAQIRRTPYARLMLHLATYLIVNVSYGIHGFVLYVQNADINNGQVLFDQGWFGPLIAMPTWWGLGLLIDSLFTWKDRGFDDVEL